MSQNKNLSKCIEIFNSILVTITDTVHNDFSDDIVLSMYNKSIKYIISSSPKEPISLFLLHIYRNDRYRTSILNKDDNFFLDTNYDGITNNDNNKIQQMLKFKAYWGKMNSDSKEYIKSSMFTLVKICDNYINML